MAANLIDTLKLIGLAAQRRHLYRFARPHHKDLAGSLSTCQVIERGIVDLMPMLKRCNKLRIVTEHAPQHGHHAVGLLHKARRLREYHDIAVIPLRKQPCAGNRISHATIQILMPVNSNGTRRHRNGRRRPDPLDIALVAIR